MQTKEISTRPLSVIETEIKAHEINCAGSIVAIGKALIEAKEQIPHGGWGDWLKRMGYAQRTADNFMRIAREVEVTPRLEAVPYTKALALLSVNSSEREQVMDEHNIDELSAAQLRKAIKERDAAAAREKRQTELSEKLSAKCHELETALESELGKKPKVIEVPPADYDKLKNKLDAEKRRADQAESYAAEAEKTLRAAKQEAQRARMAQADAEVGSPDDPLSVEAFSSACKAMLSTLCAAPHMGAYFSDKPETERQAYAALAQSVRQWADETLQALSARPQKIVTECDVL